MTCTYVKLDINYSVGSDPVHKFRVLVFYWKFLNGLKSGFYFWLTTGLKFELFGWQT